MPSLAFGAVLIGGFSLGLMPIPGEQVRAEGIAKPEKPQASPEIEKSCAPEISVPH